MPTSCHSSGVRQRCRTPVLAGSHDSGGTLAALGVRWSAGVVDRSSEEANMKFILGVVAGVIGYRFYQSRTPKPLSAPEFLEHARQSVNSAARAGAQRTVEAIDRAPVPQLVKDVAGHVTSTVHHQSTEHLTHGE